jgi:hypothetical protein
MSEGRVEFSSRHSIRLHALVPNYRTKYAYVCDIRFLLPSNAEYGLLGFGTVEAYRIVKCFVRVF